ncbi:MAG: hypothetical protein HY901_38420 [Deltaproteobacteria bacterium]|nr:hypothetical protein [Deltaproteobacteria bacterium]
MSDKPLVTTESLAEYFRQLLEGAMERQRTPLNQVTEFYLVDLLERFTDPRELYQPKSDGSLEEEPLAFQLQRALEGTREERIQALRRLGDGSLYVAGFFGDSLQRRLVDLDYYIGMGGAAYGALASMTRARGSTGAFVDLYEELCRKFITIVDLFSEVSERVSVTTNTGVVRLYERWIKTGSERLTRLLAEQGVVPAFVKPGTVQ